MGAFTEKGLEGLVLDGKRKQEVFSVDSSILVDVFKANFRTGHLANEYVLHIEPLPNTVRIMNRKLFYVHQGRLWGLKSVSMDGQWNGKKLFITLHLINKNEKGEKVEESMRTQAPQEFTDALYSKLFG